MNNKLIISIDQGSSSSRILALDPDGQIVSREVRPLTTLRPAEGQAEFDAAAMLRDVQESLEAVLEREGAGNVAALAVASQRSTVVFWDRATGKPLAPALSWQDGRAAAQVQALALPQEAVHRLTGLYNTPFYSAAKIAWVLEQVPAVARAAREERLCIGPVGSFLMWHLTQGRVFACDPTLAQRTLLFNITTGTWDEQLLQAFGVRAAWLPELKHTVDNYGVYERNGVEIPLRVCVGDQQAALYALRIGNGGACINYGTGAFFMRHTGPHCHVLPGLLTSVAASADRGPAEYLLEGPANACGTVFAWLKELGFAWELDDLDTLCPQAQHPALFLPALGGLGAPYWDFKATPVLAGLSPSSTRADVAAGVVQGLACLLADMVFYAEQYGVKSGEIKVSGGLSKSRALLHAQADILQTRLLPCVESESTATGAALLAAGSVGINASSWETLSLLPAVEPQIAPAQAQAQYQRWHQFVSWCKQGH